MSGSQLYCSERLGELGGVELAIKALFTSLEVKHWHVTDPKKTMNPHRGGSSGRRVRVRLNLAAR